jgi:soluble cytochrome b562
MTPTTAFRKTTLGLVLAAALVAGPAALCVGPAARAADEPKKEKKEGQEDTPLQKEMESIEKEMKNLRRTLRKAEQKDDSLKSVASIKASATKCKDLVPAMAKTVPEAQREKFVADFRKSMDEFIGEVDKLEAAVKAGKTDDALEIHKHLKDLEDAGHEKFTQSDKPKDK